MFTGAAHKTWSFPALAAEGSASLVIRTVSFSAGHPVRVTVQIKEFTPTDKPVTPEFRFEGVVTVAPPDKTDHAPAPVAGFDAPRVAVAAHTDWLLPAFADTADVVMVTSSGVDPQPFVRVQRRMFAPADNPETVVEKLDALANVAVPETTVQIPEFPAPGSFPASVAVVPQIVWLGPALETNPTDVMLTVYSSISPYA